MRYEAVRSITDKSPHVIFNDGEKERLAGSEGALSLLLSELS